MPAPVEGDTLDGFNADLDEATVLAHLDNPLADPHAILQRATTRLVYDLFAYNRTKDQPEPQPAVAYALARETHEADLTLDEQTKSSILSATPMASAARSRKRSRRSRDRLSESGRHSSSPRWVGTGWTVFNNKGKPVRQFEPFFTATHRFESDVRVGVSPILFYDPVARVVATLNPNHTWQKVLFDPWHQESWDVNDTVLIANPADDPDVGDFFSRLPADDYLPTWHGARIAGALGSQEQAAARKTESPCRHSGDRPHGFSWPHFPHHRAQQV